MDSPPHPLFSGPAQTTYPTPSPPLASPSFTNQNNRYSDDPYAEDGLRLAAGDSTTRPFNPTRQHSAASQLKQRGRFKAFWATYNTPNQILFLSTILFQSAVILSMIALVYGTTNSGAGDLPASVILANPKLETIATYLGLFILATIFELLVALDALQQKNSIQLFLLLAFQVAMITYSAFLPSQLRSALNGSTANVPSVQNHVQAYAIVIPCILAASTLVMAGLEWKLWHEFGWDVFKRIGADIQLKRMYLRYQIFVCFLKFTAFFIVGFSIQFLVLVTGTPLAEEVITIVSLPVILVCLILVAVAVRQEWKVGVYTFFVLDAAGMVYFIWKCVRIYDSSSESRYKIARKTLTIFSVISFLMLLITFIMVFVCMLNFNRGLKEAIPPYRWGTGRTTKSFRSKFRTDDNAAGGGEKTSGDGLNRTETRMSLD